MKCEKCGKCCKNVGRNMWRFSEHPLVKAMSKRLSAGADSGESCDMLKRNRCLLQVYGVEKPKVCSEFFCKESEK